MVTVSDIRAKFGWSVEVLPDECISAGIETAHLLVRACLAEEYKEASEIQAIKDGEIMLAGAIVLRLFATGKMPELVEVGTQSTTSSAGMTKTMEIIFTLAEMLEHEGWRLIAPYCIASTSSGSVIKITDGENTI